MSILESFDGLGLAALIKQKEVTPKELLDLVFAKAQKLNPKLNFMNHEFYDFAVKKIESGLPKGHFQGVPTLLKDLGGQCLDTPISYGSNLYKKTFSDINDEVVLRFNKAGLVFFGRSNAPEFGLSFTTEPLAFGATRNPWNTELSAGGSSGGAAALVAARISPIAHASDGGGSIRVPASNCGLFGLKPSRARVPAGPLVGEAWGGFATHHVLTLSVRDSAAMLDCIAGPALGDPYFAPESKTSFQKSLDIPVKPLRIGVIETLHTDEEIDPKVKHSLEKTIKLLLDLGHKIETFELSADINSMRHSFVNIASANVLNMLNQYEKRLGHAIKLSELEPITQSFVQFAENLSAADYAESVQTIHYNSRTIAHDFEKVDLVLMPTTAKTAPPIRELSGHNTDLKEFNAKQLAFSPYTAIANMTGQPAMSVPLFWTEDNFPIGSQFIAKAGDEKTLFQLARQLELAKPWFDKVPPI